MNNFFTFTDNPNLTEIRLVPSDSSSLETMFKLMSEIQTFHPDPNDSLSEDSELEDEDEDENENEDENGDKNDNEFEAIGCEALESENNKNSNDDEEMDVVPGQFDDD